VKIQVLGTGCAKCKQLTANAEEAVATLGLGVLVEKVEDPRQIMKFGVLTTPALVVDGKVLVAENVLAPDAVLDLLAPLMRAGCSDCSTTPVVSSSKSSSCCAGPTSTPPHGLAGMTVPQYVRLFAGAFTLLSLSLGAPASPAFQSQSWLWFAAFVGVMMSQSAFTGFCPMANALRALGVREQT
jgi:small redox-active disulfide protein 2